MGLAESSADIAKVALDGCQIVFFGGDDDDWQTRMVEGGCHTLLMKIYIKIFLQNRFFLCTNWAGSMQKIAPAWNEFQVSEHMGKKGSWGVRNTIWS